MTQARGTSAQVVRCQVEVRDEERCQKRAQWIVGKYGGLITCCGPHIAAAHDALGGDVWLRRLK